MKKSSRIRAVMLDWAGTTVLSHLYLRLIRSLLGIRSTFRWKTQGETWDC